VIGREPFAKGGGCCEKARVHIEERPDVVRSVRSGL